MIVMALYNKKVYLYMIKKIVACFGKYDTTDDRYRISQRWNISVDDCP